jgi:NSS family neurotransmitter:Na+ symporter
MGYLAAAVPSIILPYYCVIGGWVMKYLFAFLTGEAQAAQADSYFTDFITLESGALLNNPMLWFLLFALLTTAFILMGVEKGVEKASRIMMPLLIVLSVVVAAFSLTMKGALGGLKYYLLPDFSAFSAKTVMAALGQLFFSMSIAMGIMVTYGSYMKTEDNLERAVGQIEIFDTAIAFIAGLMVIPAVFAFSGGDESALSAGAGLMFITLPKVFGAMKFGTVIGAAFFLLVLFAALTSSISIMEAVVSNVQDATHWSRKKSTLVVMVAMLLIGILPGLGYGPLSVFAPLGMSFLDFFDFVANSVMMPVVALLTCILVGRAVGVQIVQDEVEKCGLPFQRKKVYDLMIGYVAPILIVVILVSSVLQGLGVFSL